MWAFGSPTDARPDTNRHILTTTRHTGAVGPHESPGANRLVPTSWPQPNTLTTASQVSAVDRDGSRQRVQVAKHACGARQQTAGTVPQATETGAEQAGSTAPKKCKCVTTIAC